MNHWGVARNMIGVLWRPDADPAVTLSEISRGVALGDLDLDGDTDIVLTNNSGPLRVLRNDTPSTNHWVALRLQGTTSARSADGARLQIEDAAGTVRWRRVHADGSYLSASDREVVVGLHSADGPVDVTVHWPSGGREQWQALATRARHVLVEGAGDAVSASGSP